MTPENSTTWCAHALPTAKAQQELLEWQYRGMIRPAGAALAALAVLTAGCSVESEPAAVATSTPAAASTSTAFPEPPPYTHTIEGAEIRVWTSSADPTDLLDTYNHVARTLRSTLAEGGYWVRINCETGGSDTADNRLANGHIGVGRLGIAQTGDLGGFDGVVPGATCP
ncbi:hypothetical protein [Nocardia puris]|uniref:hypothetical protein n=1 Tax=Nocardia puris TaxID=208602 RepID=UPI002E24C97F